MTLLRALTIIICFAFVSEVKSADAIIAVAANFKDIAKALVVKHQAQTGFELSITSGASGKLMAQITQGAPFDAFLSADTELPSQLVRDGLAIKGSAFVYAQGRLVFASYQKINGPFSQSMLLGYESVAMANPRHAPYGKAAEQTLAALNLWPYHGKMITGENVAQVMSYIVSGSVGGGFVPASFKEQFDASLFYQEIPQSFYKPIKQSAVLLKDNKAARSFLSFLHTREVQAFIEQQGFGHVNSK